MVAMDLNLILEASDKLSKTQTVDEAIAILNLELHNIGYEGFSYLEAFVKPDKKRTPRYFTTANPSFIQRYLDERFDLIDPVVSMAKVTTRPFTWTNASDKSPESKTVWQTAEDYGYNNGLVIPARSYKREVGGILVTLFKRYESDDVEKPEYQLASRSLINAFYDRMNDFDTNPVFQNEGYVLSEREREVLLWSAYGKTSSETAAILGISERGVNFHINNCLDKLGASCKTQAVVRAYQRGEINP